MPNHCNASTASVFPTRKCWKNGKSFKFVFWKLFSENLNLFFQEEAAARDHRRIGKAQDLFHFDGVSPGSCFFLPNGKPISFTQKLFVVFWNNFFPGAHIYNTLVEMMRQEYRKRGFHEVISPNIYSTRLWDMSGHSGHYLQNMFLWVLFIKKITLFSLRFEVEKEVFGLKPMNCPGHCMLYKSQPRTHAQLPIRWADFGVLHRWDFFNTILKYYWKFPFFSNELSGALTGLTRVRRFQQDDAHIFARMDQIGTVREEFSNLIRIYFK